MRFLLQGVIGFMVLMGGTYWALWLMENNLADTWLGFVAGIIIGTGYFIGLDAEREE